MLMQTAAGTISSKPITKPAVPVPAARALSGGIELMGAPMTLARHVEIYGESAPARTSPTTLD